MHRAGFEAIVLLSVLVVPLFAQSGPPAKEGVRIPNNVEQLKVDRPLREKYKADFASRDPAVRGALAHKFREEANSTADTVTKFVLLREARDLSVDAGDFTYCFDVIEDIAAVFPINGNEAKANALAAGIDRARLPRDELARSYLKTADEQMDKWELDLADKAAYAAMKVATGNRELLEQARMRDKLARAKTTELHAAQAAAKRLEKNPDDPEQNQIVGRHLCFNVGRWETGLPYLAKSASSELKRLAERELANPADAAAMASLADEWWDFKDPKAALPPGAARRRAAYWYGKALAGLTGEKRAEAEKRIAEANPIPSSP